MKIGITVLVIGMILGSLGCNSVKGTDPLSLVSTKDVSVQQKQAEAAAKTEAEAAATATAPAAETAQKV